MHREVGVLASTHGLGTWRLVGSIKILSLPLTKTDILLYSGACFDQEYVMKKDEKCNGLDAFAVVCVRCAAFAAL